MRLSVIVITRNEQINIAGCLLSVDFADEVVIVDSASTDDTREIARSLGARVTVVQDWPGFGPQKNRALAQAQGEWILSIDADERVTPELKAEILAVMADPRSGDVYQIPRRSSYCGQFMLHSGWNPDYVTRLFRSGCAVFSDDLVHERLISKAQVAKLDSLMLHLSFPDFESVLDKVNRYSSAGSASLSAKNKAATLWGAIGHGAWSFFRTYVLRRGFLDGQLGLALAISNAEGTYYRYAKRWLEMRNERLKRGTGRP